mgnify:CR=1 FL=1
MIPKVIHYCWFGGNPLPEMAIKCIDSWKKFFPDYEIKQWNESNFDINLIPYIAEAYKAKKYAFVSDYARFWILYNYGGLYFDTDVQVIKNMDDIIAKGPFMGCEKEALKGKTPMDIGVAPGLGLGVNPGLGLYKEMLDLYETLHFVNKNGSYNQTTIVSYTTNVLCKHGLRLTSEIQQCGGIWIYPKEYFCPLDYITKKLEVTTNTRSIHLYSASWITKQQLMYKRIENIIGQRSAHFLATLLKKIKLFR